MDSNLVIKVKFGDTVRRFSVLINGNGTVGIGMAGLKTKICNLFKLCFDDVILTYVDEDQDVITLVDDNDLCDVLSQHLNPLRINIQLKTKTAETFDQSRSSSPKSSQQGEGSAVSHINSGVAEVLKSLPEPVRDVLSKLSHDLVSKAVPSAPALSELLVGLAKLSLHPSAPVSESRANDSNSSVDAKVTKGPDASKFSVSRTEVFDHGKSIDPVGPSNTELLGSFSTDEVIGTPKPESTTSVNLPKGSGESGELTTNKSAPVNHRPSYVSRVSSKMPHKHPRSKYPSLSDLAFFRPRAPVSASAVADKSNIRSHGGREDDYDITGRVVHYGVQCDGCGAHPIIGPWFKSKTREDYDLCSICFSERGNEVDFIRVYNPNPYAHYFPGFSPPSPFLPPPPPTHIMLGRGAELTRPRNELLDCCFVQDVKIPDGTVIAPNTQFTKTWRMRNSGTIPWPTGTLLVWIGGSQLSKESLQAMKISANDVPVGNELDISLRCMSPSVPGRYISYWRMQSPSGKRFGQRVWLLIEVDDKPDKFLYDSSSEKINSFNLNSTPKASDKLECKQTIDMNAEPAESDSAEHVQSSKREGQFKPMVDEELKDQNLDCSIDFNLNCRNSVPTSPKVPGYSTVPSPVVFADELSDQVQVNYGNSVEEKLLRELEEMGFKQVDLNKEILRLNEYNLAQSVDDLCGVSEWDPIMEELEEMGFSDKETNKRLLIKNGGSIKQVVMDLVAGEKSF